MWLSESRAKETRCCGPNLIAQAAIAMEQGELGVVDTCIASGCMAWRWRPHPDGEPQGRCGLAGGVEATPRSPAGFVPPQDGRE